MVEVREAKGLRAPTLQLNGEHTALHARVHLALRARAPPLACLSVGLGPQPLFQLARTRWVALPFPTTLTLASLTLPRHCYQPRVAEPGVCCWGYSPAPTDERLREVRITGDGRCMFRALVRS